VRIFYESTVRKPLLDDGLGLLHGKAADVHVINQREVRVSIATHPGSCGEIGDVINTELKEVA
jgi:hypothetical protein